MTMDEVSSIKIGADDRKKKHYKFSGNFELNVKMTQKTPHYIVSPRSFNTISIDLNSVVLLSFQLGSRVIIIRNQRNPRINPCIAFTGDRNDPTLCTDNSQFNVGQFQCTPSNGFSFIGTTSCYIFLLFHQE